MFDAKMKADSLEVLFNKEKNTHKWATVGLELTDILLRRMKYDAALNISIMVYEKVKAMLKNMWKPCSTSKLVLCPARNMI